jgi:hypothetical protein
MNCLLIAVKRRHLDWYCLASNVFSIVQMTQTLIGIDVVYEVGKSLETPSNVIL